jgi:hypothetical protein
MNRLGDVNRLITLIDVRETEWEGTGSYIIIFSEATFFELSWKFTANLLAPNFALWIRTNRRQQLQRVSVTKSCDCR